MKITAKNIFGLILALPVWPQEPIFRLFWCTLPELGEGWGVKGDVFEEPPPPKKNEKLKLNPNKVSQSVHNPPWEYSTLQFLHIV